MRRELNLGLYLVTDERLSRGRPTAEIVRAAIRGGVDAVQLRGKDLPMREQVAIGRALREITREAGVLFIVNDRADLAVALDADGVHVGQDDLPADLSRYYRLPAPVKYLHVQLIFQLFDHHAKRGLGNMAMLCRFYKMAMVIHRYYILQLLNIHLSVVYVRTTFVRTQPVVGAAQPYFMQIVPVTAAMECII